MASDPSSDPPGTSPNRPAWQRFLRDKVERAATSGRTLALASVAFLAVYREGFETVLFYKALYMSGGAGAGAPGVAIEAAAGPPRPVPVRAGEPCIQRYLLYALPKEVS